jgi:hypothetical protein
MPNPNVRLRAIVLATTKAITPLVAGFLFYSIILAATDNYHRLQSSVNCLICKFTQNLSGGDETVASVVVEVPMRDETAELHQYLAILGRIPLSPTGSRAPPYLLPSSGRHSTSVVTL